MRTVEYIKSSLFTSKLGTMATVKALYCGSEEEEEGIGFFNKNKLFVGDSCSPESTFFCRLQ